MSEGWGDKVTVVLHYVREDEAFESGYEAVTMTGVPTNVIVTGTDDESAEGALSHLSSGLRAFGFTGRIAVEDATTAGRIDRYEQSV